MRQFKRCVGAVLAGLLVIAPAAKAQAPADQIYASLERVANATARITTIVCGADGATLARAAMDAIGAMPGRYAAAEAPVTDLSSFFDAYAALVEEDGSDPRALESTVINGMLRVVDESAEYGFYTARAGDGAIGLTLVMDGASPVVVSAVPDSPAAEAGILQGDRLLAVDGWPVQGATLNEILRRLHGDIGSSVTLDVGRGGRSTAIVLERLRLAPIIPVRWRVLDGVGVITVAEFPQGSERLVRNAIRAIRREVRQPAGYVLDLRDNTGGPLDQLIEAADHFIDGGQVATVRSFGDCHPPEAQTYSVRHGEETHGAPLVVLINGYTSSGAEWLAAALRERRGATLIGQTTRGFGRIHTVIPIRPRGQAFLKVTTGLLTLPSGFGWDGVGVAPDVETPHAAGESDPALDQALAQFRRPAATE